MRIKLLILFLLVFNLSLSANTRYNTWTKDLRNTEISLLTCTPDDEIYSIFGHTAIRINNPYIGLDEVVNYGLFDFNQENFIYRFVKGETDYMCGIEDYNSFIFYYMWRGSGIKETVLNLTNSEKERFLKVLDYDLKPENRTYRYNFAYNNCATKIRDIINYTYSGTYESIIPSEFTFREVIGIYAKEYPWYMFGFDICLGGKEYNTIMTPEEAQFLPELLDVALNNSIINRDGEELRPTTFQRMIVEPTKEVKEAGFFTPMILCQLILVLSLINLFWGSKCVIASKIYSGTIFLSCTIIGAIITFLMLFSEHPFTSGNMNICIFNLFYIIPFISLMVKENKFFKVSQYILIAATVFYAAYLLIFYDNINFAFWYLAIAILLELLKSSKIITLKHKD